ncbi:hypothetical protein ACWGB8_24055 [Kitasatospora sp. NPDC054939]
MGSPRCGKCRRPVAFGPFGGYVCPACYYVVPTRLDAGPTGPGPVPSEIGMSGGHCARCGAETIHGPLGGYVCGMCGNVEEPPGAETDRRDAAKAREARQQAAQEQRTAAPR